MALNITTGAALALVALLGFVGFRRDPRRGVLALAGTLLGAIMVGFWGEPWGRDLAGRFVGGDPGRLTFIVSSLIFLVSVLVVGYGGGLLLGPQERPPFPRRLASALLGLLDGALVAGYLLRFGTASDLAFLEIVRGWLPARVLHDGLPLLFLVVTIGVALLVLIRAVFLLGGPKRAAPAKPAPAPPQKPAAPPAAPPSAPSVDDRDVLDKVNRHVS